MMVEKTEMMTMAVMVLIVLMSETKIYNLVQF